MNLVNGGVVFDEYNTVGVTRGNLAVLLMHTHKEEVILGFEAIFVCTLCRCGPSIATARAGQRNFKRWQKQDGHLRLKIFADGLVKGEHTFAANSTPAALVGFG
jgi:hypothetical protein